MLACSLGCVDLRLVACHGVVCAQVLSEALAWVASAIADFGLAFFDVRCLLGWAKDCLANAGAAGVRNSAIQMLGSMHT